jgi:hypothetical protein
MPYLLQIFAIKPKLGMKQPFLGMFYACDLAYLYIDRAMDAASFAILAAMAAAAVARDVAAAASADA